MGSKGPAAIWWVRRDFRLADNPALRSAIDDGEAVLPLFVLDPYLLGSAGQVRRAWLMAALYGLDSDLRNAGGSGLSVTSGNPAAVVPHSAMPLRTFLSRCAGGTCTRERCCMTSLGDVRRAPRHLRGKLRGAISSPTSCSGDRKR